MHGLFLTEGTKAVSELLKSDYETERIIGIGEDSAIPGIEQLDKADLASISSFKTPTNVIAIAHIKPFQPHSKSSGPLFLLDSIRDPGNLGTIIRTVRWFGGSELILSNDCADIYNPKTIQASMGAVFHMGILMADLQDPIEKLRSTGYRIIGTEMSGEPMEKTDFPFNSAIVIGNEGHGISQDVLDLCDETISIEGGNVQGVESLNAAMSVGIIAHHLYTLSDGK